LVLLGLLGLDMYAVVMPSLVAAGLPEASVILNELAVAVWASAFGIEHDDLLLSVSHHIRYLLIV
jgi:hypothetical protein